MRLYALAISAVLCASPTRASAQPRKYVEGSWQEVLRIDGEHGFALSEPIMLALSGNAILVCDNGSHSIISFSRDGHTLWEAGDPGESPNALDRPTSLIGDGKGGAMFLDREGKRFTILSPTGEFVSRTEFAFTASRIAMLSDGRIAVAPPLGTNVLDLDSWRKQSGRVKIAMPPVVQTAQGPLMRMLVQPGLAGTSVGTVLLTFLSTTEVQILNAKFKPTKTFQLLNEQKAGGVFVPNRDSPVRPGERLQNDPDQRVIRSMSVINDSLYIVDDRTMATGASIDAYSAITGAYGTSRMLPKLPIAVARVDGDLLFGLISAPVSAVVIWRWIPAR